MSHIKTQIAQSGDETKVRPGRTRRNVIAIAGIVGSTALVSTIAAKSAFAGWNPVADSPGNSANKSDRFCDTRGESGANSHGNSDSSHSSHQVCQGGGGRGGNSGGGSANGGGGGGGNAGGGNSRGSSANAGGGNSGGGSTKSSGRNSGGSSANAGGENSGGGRTNAGGGGNSSGGSANAGGGNSGGGRTNTGGGGNSGGGGANAGGGNSGGGGGGGWDLGLGGDGPGNGGGGSGWGGGGGRGGVACFLAGTKILTANVERTVEDLRAGDTLPTISGGTRAIQKIQSWTAERRDNEKWSADVAPIKVCRGALGANLPRMDLYLSPNHALYVDGVLITAGNLVNGSSIVRCSDYDSNLITYFHIELEDHNVIWANGAPVESRLTESMTPFAPIWGGGRRFELNSRLRSAISPWIDTRTAFDKIRDRIEERSEFDHAIA